MEKNAVKSERKFSSGLLILIFLILTVFLNLISPQNAYAKTLSRSELKNLELKADSNIFFTAQENGYTLQIPGIESDSVQTDLGMLPAGVKLLSSKKEEFFDEDNQRGTMIHLWFSFTDTGIAKLPPLIAKIKGRTYYLPFESVQIYENPNLISPVLGVEFDDTSKIKTDRKTGISTYNAKTGDEIRYKVYIQYFQQILNYSWELPKNSICTETKRYNTDSAPGKEFTPVKFPVAEYSWKPLKEGEYELPAVYVEAVSYNGSRKQLTIPPVVIVSVKKAGGNASLSALSSATGVSGSAISAETKQALRSAFTENKIDLLSAVRYTPTAEDCRHLAELRSAELHSSFWNRTPKEKRVLFEKSLGIYSAESEPSNPLSRLLNSSYGIFAGGDVSPVPEENAVTHHAAGAQRVRIAEKAAGWFYIEHKDFSGWVKQELVFEIK